MRVETLPDPRSRRPAVERAARWMSARAVDLADQHRAHLAAGGIGTPRHVYDVITGLAGIGRVLLAAVRAGHDAETELGTGAAAPVSGRRDAWCYGTPGIHRALILAGQATADPSLGEAARSALDTLTTRPASRWDVEGPALCHGYAGVLQATRDDQAATAVTALFNERDRYSFRPAAKRSETSEDPGFLTGAAGAALALADHGAIPGLQVADPWDALLLLS